MKFRSVLFGALLALGFVWVMNRSHSSLFQILPGGGGSAPLFTENVAHGAGLGTDEQNNIDIYKNSKDAVVYITSTQTVFRDTFFWGPQREQVSALGSGFLINADGQILTNNHVVSGSSTIEVTLPNTTDKTTYKATILQRDRSNDLALIKISGKKFPALSLGDSSRLQVGQKVLAIGNPFGFAGTLTVGVVSTLNRAIQASEESHLEGMIQTDAAINEGNSGGPLLDSQGAVIGINTAIFSPQAANGTAGSVGIGFAMPINRAKGLLEDFRAGRKPAAGIGVSTYYFKDDWAQALRYPASGGLLILRVQRGSAAERAGLRGPTEYVIVGNQRIPYGGDFITAIDGKKVDSEEAIAQVARGKHAGDSIELTIIRGGRTVTVKVTLQSDELV